MSTPHHDPSPGAPGYGYAPAGYGQHPGYGYGPTGYGPGPAPTNGLAVAALILGIVSLLGGLVPILGWFVSPFALAAIGFAIAGLSRAKTVHKGRGLAIAGLLTGVLSLIAITVWTAWLVVGTKETADIWSGEGLFSCEAVRDSLEDDVEEFRATEGREPTSQDELVSEGYRTWSSSDYEIVVTDGRAEVVTREDGDC